MKKVYNTDISKIISLLVIFICIAIFYVFNHPLYVFDTDDWTYIAETRLPLPNIHEWNPTRVLPEYLFPFVGQIGASIIYPITGDYIQALAFAFSFFVSIIITVYFAFCMSLIYKSFKINRIQWIMLLAIFVLYHFCDNRTSYIVDNYALYGQSLTNTIYYIVCSLFNALFVIYLMKEKLMIKNIDIEKRKIK